jgi:ribonuclease Z
LPYIVDTQIKCTGSDGGLDSDDGPDTGSDTGPGPDTSPDPDTGFDHGDDTDPRLNTGANILELRLGDILVRCHPVYHNLPCLAYTMELKRQGRFDTERARRLGVPVDCWNALQKGRTLQLGDRTIRPDMVLGEPRKGIKVSYCTDTRPTDGLAGFVKDSDLFICEGMYGDEEDAQKAVLKKHMTFSEAAVLAKQANVKELWLTHFSPSLTDPEAYGDAALAIFENTVAGKDLMAKTIKFEEE